MKRSLVSTLASLLLALEVWAGEPRWTVEFKEGRYTFETSFGLEVGQQPVEGKSFPGYILLNLPADVDPATTNRAILLGRVRIPEGRVTWLKGTEYSIGEMLPAHHRVVITPNAGFEPGLWAVTVKDSVRDKTARSINPKNAMWTVDIGTPPSRAAKRPVTPTAQAVSSAVPLFPGGQPMGWQGHWTDPVTGLIDMRGRWYDPRNGTFLSPDPMDDIDSTNLYLFGGGRPHEVMDPLGLQSCKQCPLLFGASQGNRESIDTLNALSMWGQYGPPTFIAASAALGPMALGPLALEAAPLLPNVAAAVKARAGAAVLSGSLATSILSNPGIVQRGGQVVVGLTVPGPSLSSEVPTAAKAGAAAMPVTTIIPKGARALGKWGESRLAQALNWAGSKPEKPLQTSLGARYVDRLVDGVAHEAKAGANVKLTQSIETQVLKDVELIKSRQITGAHWHFFQDVQEDVLDFLRAHGIEYTVHPLH